MGKQDRSLRDGNGRVARLARWLAQVPASAGVDVLILEFKEEGDWKKLQIWKLSEVTQQLAMLIDATVTELANELGQYLTARVVWSNSETGNYWTEHSLRVQPEDFEGAQAFAGDQTSIAIQNQRHQERLMGSAGALIQANAASLMQTNTQLVGTNDLLGQENMRLREELFMARERNGELEQEISRLTGMLESAVDTAERAGERTAEADKTGQVLQLVQAAIAAAPKAS